MRNENLTEHQHIILDGYISATQSFDFFIREENYEVY